MYVLLFGGYAELMNSAVSLLMLFMSLTWKESTLEEPQKQKKGKKRKLESKQELDKGAESDSEDNEKLSPQKQGDLCY